MNPCLALPLTLVVLQVVLMVAATLMRVITCAVIALRCQGTEPSDEEFMYHLETSRLARVAFYLSWHA